MLQPLVSRPAYGQPVAQSGLPKGEPGGKGLSLDKDIPGTSTFNKPEGETREFDKAEEGSIYRKDGPDDLAKPQDKPKDDRREMEWVQPRYDTPGGRPPDDPTVTKYPYRDKRPNKHYASSQYIVQAFLLGFSREASITFPRMARVATRLEEVLTGLDQEIGQRSTACSVLLKRADVNNLRWIFVVDCGNGPKAVKVKAKRVGNVVRLVKMDIRMTCSCKAWQWLGPEYHAKQQGYIDGAPRGTASTPDIKDPERDNRVCKHVAAVLSSVRNWEIPVARKTKT